MRFPAEYLRFIDMFNDQQYWHSHEVLEGAWRRNGSTFYKGLIIFASAFVHAQRGNPIGVRKQIAKCFRYLPTYAPNYLGIDVEALLLHAKVCLDRAIAWEEERASAVPEFPTYRLEPRLELIRGDEAELNA